MTDHVQTEDLSVFEGVGNGAFWDMQARGKGFLGTTEGLAYLRWSDRWSGLLSSWLGCIG